MQSKLYRIRYFTGRRWLVSTGYTVDRREAEHVALRWEYSLGYVAMVVECLH